MTDPFPQATGSIFLSDQPPTQVRWRIVILLMGFAGLCHFNRLSISVAGTERIMPEYGISETQMGTVYSTYLFVYTACMMPGGWLIDRLGPKRALLLMGLGSALLVPATGLASLAVAGGVVASLCAIRGLLGLISAPMHPGAAREVSFWIPPRSRGIANGLVTASALIGMASTYFVFGFLMDSLGWPKAFLVAGIVTLSWSLIWLWYGTDDPGLHPGVNTAERELFLSDGAPAHSAAPPAVEPPDLSVASESATPGDPSENRSSRPEGFVVSGLFDLLRNRNLVLVTCSYAAISYFQYMLFYWIQHYFDTVFRMEKVEGRLYATIPLLAMAAGMASGGWVSDQFRAQFGVRVGRAIVPICGLTASAVLLILGVLVGHPTLAVTLIALAMAAAGASESSFWITGIEAGGHRGGLAAAILNTGGNAGGIPAPWLTPLIGERFGWPTALGVASAFCLVGAALWFFIDPRQDQNP